MTKRYDTNTIIDSLGGNASAAEYFNVSEPAISGWRKSEKIPAARLVHLYQTKPELFNGRPYSLRKARQKNTNSR